MRDGPHIAGIASLVGDTARAEVLCALLADRALTATELAQVADVTKQTISAHMAKLVEAGLVAVESQGRHRYFRLAAPDVAQLLESLMGVAFRTGAVRLRSSPREPALRKARVCYDHLAGEIGVSVFERMVKRKALVREGDALTITPAGRRLFAALDIDTESLARQRRAFCKPCLDWSERRHHLAGALGGALFTALQKRGWLRRERGSRVVRVSAQGERAIDAWLRA
jgi:DNA-binding transcriptional ArsR family regulator